MRLKNKTISNLAIMLTIFSVILSCHKADPVACATIPTSGKVNTGIAFTSCSTDAHHEEWDFGDGSSKETGSSKTHTYSKTGQFTVTLTAANADMTVTSAKSGTITITQ